MSLPEKSFEPGGACPLDGVRVIDMSRLVSGNMVSLQLADFGAEVVKIEDPKRGDPLRAWQTDGVSVHWKVYSRNKKSLAMSLREARASCSSNSPVPSRRAHFGRDMAVFEPAEVTAVVAGLGERLACVWGRWH